MPDWDRLTPSALAHVFGLLCRHGRQRIAQLALRLATAASTKTFDVGVGELGPDLLAALRARRVQFVVLKRYNVADPVVAPLADALARGARRVARIPRIVTRAADMAGGPFPQCRFDPRPAAGQARANVDIFQLE